MNGRSSQKSSKERPIGPYRNSVSYGRWHSSLAVRRGANGKASKSKTSDSDQEEPSNLSKYFYNCSSQTQPDTELAFEALRKCTHSKENNVKMTANAGHCIAHIKDLKRLNHAYLGSDAKVIQGYINKEKSEFPEIDLTVSQQCADLRILCAKLKSPIKPENPYKNFARDKPQPSTEIPLGNLDHVFGKEADHSNELFVKPKTMLRKPSKSKMEKASGPKMSTQQVFWGAANSQNIHPVTGTSKDKLVEQKKLPTTLSELVSGSDFVFNPKYAEKLGKVPEFRRQLIPANALPVRVGSLRIQSVASVSVSNFTQNNGPSKLVKK